jgi:hypothetical protein
MTDIGNMTHGLRDNTLDLFEIWITQPERRQDFGPRELQDISDVAATLSALVDEMIGFTAINSDGAA